MTERIKNIFKENIDLIDTADKAVYYFRSQNLAEGLLHVTQTVEGICSLVENIVRNKEFFRGVDFESMLEMMEGITEAKKKEDYVLLADLYEMQVIDFACRIQEYIINREPCPYDPAINRENLSAIREFDEELYRILAEPFDTETLLEEGYFVEYASSGLMTLAAREQEKKYYFHSNGRAGMEGFLFARNVLDVNSKDYDIYGLGMGYHIKELARLVPHGKIRVFEGDLNIIRLACAFSDLRTFLGTGRVALVYDPEYEKAREAMEQEEEGRKFSVHFPSCRNVRKPEIRALLKKYIAGSEILEEEEAERKR